MKPDRLIRVNELLKREIGDYFARTLTLERDGLDRSRLTVTHVITSSNLRAARVLVSIFGLDRERPGLLARLDRHKPDLQRQIARRIALKYTPRLTFELDTSLIEGDRMLDLLKAMEQESSAAPAPGAPAP